MSLVFSELSSQVWSRWGSVGKRRCHLFLCNNQDLTTFESKCDDSSVDFFSYIILIKQISEFLIFNKLHPRMCFFPKTFSFIVTYLIVNLSYWEIPQFSQALPGDHGRFSQTTQSFISDFQTYKTLIFFPTWSNFLFIFTFYSLWISTATFKSYRYNCSSTILLWYISESITKNMKSIYLVNIFN